MKRSAFLFLLVAAAWSFGPLRPDASGAAAGSPGVADAGLPVPPAQTRPWVAPFTNLPPGVLRAVTELFNQGLADPRGCEYREIVVEWGEEGVPTRGWVIPGTTGTAYAVAWNGLVYPLKSVGAAVSLEEEFSHAKATEAFRGLEYDWPVGEYMSLGHQSMLPIKVAFLLRLGRSDLAEDYWRRGFAGKTLPSREEPYVLLAKPWLSALFDRAVQAHDRGDDPRALATCRFLLPRRSAAEASAARQGIAKPAGHALYFEMLKALPELAADQERRAREPAYTPTLESGRPSHGPERVAALIRDLEQVSVHQQMNPGQANVYDDPIVQALIAEGDPAVEPLLTCWEEDPRLTRSRFTEHMAYEGPMIPVYEAAYVALDGILDKPFYFADADEPTPTHTGAPSDPRDRHPRELTPQDRKFLGAKMRAYWAGHKHLTLPERWLAILGDDGASPDAWCQAAERITIPFKQRDLSFGIYGGSMGWGFPLAPGQPMEGEPLRGKSNPSVGDLFVRRLKQLTPAGGTTPAVTGTQFGHLIVELADWDGKAHLDEIRGFGEVFHARFPKENAGFTSSRDIEASIFQRRVYLDDPRALADYAAWLGELKPEDLSAPLHPERPFQIMWHYPMDPTMQQAAARMFTTPGSSWVPLRSVLVSTPLIGLAAFRQELARGLHDRTPAGTVTVEENAVRYEAPLTGGSHGESPGDAKDDPLAPKPGSVVAFRVCDCYAAQLSQVEGFPACKLFWPEARRDEAVAACAAFLERYGAAYASRPEDPYDDAVGRRDSGRAEFSLPPLDHPATPDDVTAGRALFSLPGLARVWKLPAVPLGPVWQAEETLVDGKWVRYYGIVKEGQALRVPAAETELTNRYQQPANVTEAIRGDITGPTWPVPDRISLSFFVRRTLPAGAPVPIKVTFCNRHGLGETLPGSLTLPEGAGARTLPEGIAFAVSRARRTPPVVERFTRPRFDDGGFEEIPLRPEVSVNHDPHAGPTLAPLQTVTALDIDLRDFFDVGRPGLYHVKALFHVPGQSPGESGEIVFSVGE